MRAAQHAKRILEAWSSSDMLRLENELASALLSCRKERSPLALECEQQELLEGVVEHLQSSNARAEASLALLRHLSARATRTAAAGV